MVRHRMISAEEAEAEFGVKHRHEMMENGEARFRLISEDGSSYIRTVRPSGEIDKHGWQKSHFHKGLRETYVVQSGLMVFVSLHDDKPVFEALGAGSVITTEPYVPHNVYLREGTVIHTVKHGDPLPEDWYPHDELDAHTRNLSECETMRRAEERRSGEDADVDERFAAYVSIYNNLDAIIWRMPAFLLGVITVILGLTFGVLGSKQNNVTPELLGGVFVIAGLIMWIGAFGLRRLRKHHTMMGRELKKLETEGYFHEREKTLSSLNLPGAPLVFVIVFQYFAYFLFVLGLASFLEYEPFLSALGLGGAAPDTAAGLAGSPERVSSER